MDYDAGARLWLRKAECWFCGRNFFSISRTFDGGPIECPDCQMKSAIAQDGEVFFTEGLINQMKQMIREERTIYGPE